MKNFGKKNLFLKVCDRLQISLFYTIFLCSTEKLKKELQSYCIKRPRLLDDLCTQLKIGCFLTLKDSGKWFLQLQRSKSILQTKNIGKVEILKISPREALCSSILFENKLSLGPSTNYVGMIFRIFDVPSSPTQANILGIIGKNGTFSDPPSPSGCLHSL